MGHKPTTPYSFDYIEDELVNPDSPDKSISIRIPRCFDFPELGDIRGVTISEVKTRLETHFGQKYQITFQSNDEEAPDDHIITEHDVLVFTPVRLLGVDDG